jgi:transcriptional pleiotropic regulator of transition state genes
MGKGNKGKIDNLGRIVIPKTIRDALDVKHNDEVSMTVEKGNLVISKGYKTCSLCSTKEVTTQISDKLLCEKCISEIKNL